MLFRSRAVSVGRRLLALGGRRRSRRRRRGRSGRGTRTGARWAVVALAFRFAPGLAFAVSLCRLLRLRGEPSREPKKAPEGKTESALTANESVLIFFLAPAQPHNMRHTATVEQRSKMQQEAQSKQNHTQGVMRGVGTSSACIMRFATELPSGVGSQLTASMPSSTRCSSTLTKVLAWERENNTRPGY